MIGIIIPGEPVAQGRPRATTVGGHARVYDPKLSRSWKGAARVAMQEGLNHWLEKAGPMGWNLSPPMEVTIWAFFTCPKSRWLKSRPRPAIWRNQKPDIENVVKAVLDAGTGVLWLDDRQIVSLHTYKVTGEQEQAPGIILCVKEMDWEAPTRNMVELLMEGRRGVDSDNGVSVPSERTRLGAGSVPTLEASPDSSKVG